jgi:flagellar motor protein MotB
MSTYDDDDDIEFDFFDEPETVEATQRGRRLPRRERPGDGGSGDGPRRPPMRTPTGLIPLARLVGLIAIAIAVVVALVFWVGACQGKNKHDDYAAYAAKVKTIADSSRQLGEEFSNKLISTGLKQGALEQGLQQYAQQEQQAYDQAQQIRAPGPLRQIHQQLVDALELRARGLAGLGDTLSQTASAKEAADAAQKLADRAQLLVASDVVWDELYRAPATQQLATLGITGVVIPESHFVANPELLSVRSFGILFASLHTGASTGGTPSGKHGDGLVSVKTKPQGLTLSTDTATTVQVSAALAFDVTVEDSGDFQEVNVPVTLTIDAGGTPIVKRKSIQVIQAAQQLTVTFDNFELPTSAFGAKATVKVEVGPVPGEINTANNAASYSVFFTLPTG